MLPVNTGAWCLVNVQCDDWLHTCCCALCLQVILDTLELSTKIKKTPVVVGNCTGFAVNRVFFPYTQVQQGSLHLHVRCSFQAGT